MHKLFIAIPALLWTLQIPGQTLAPAREEFRKIAMRSNLAILHEDDLSGAKDKADKALDEVHIEMQPGPESDVFKLLVTFQAKVQTNLASMGILWNEIQIAKLEGRDLTTKIEAAETRRLDMDQRELSCFRAIEDMLRQGLTDKVPECINVVVD